MPLRALQADGCCGPTRSNSKPTAAALHTKPSASRQKPLSPRTMILACGQRRQSRNDGPQGTQRTLVGIALAGAQFGRNRHFADESIEGQVTVVAVIGMKESPLLAAMKQIVCGVEIDDHLTGLLIGSADAFSDQQGLNLRVVRLDLEALACALPLSCSQRRSRPLKYPG